MADYILTVSSLIAIILCIIPGIFHVQTRNWGAIFMTFWVLLTNMIIFINSILWANDLDDKAPAYCYITAPLYNAAHFGILTSTTCMIHTLYNYVVNPVLLTERVKRRQAYLHLVVSIIVPFFLVGLSYLNAQYVYAIRPVLGCFIESGRNLVYIVVDGMWPVLISGVGCYFAVRTSYTIIKKRLEIQSLLKYSKSGLNTAKFYRLVLFCISFLLIAFPSACITLFSNLDGSLKPYDFYQLHENFTQVVTFQSPVTLIDYVKPLTGLLVLVFFGTGHDAKQAYLRWFKKMKLDTCFGFKKDDKMKFSDVNNNSTIRSLSNNNTLSNNSSILPMTNTNSINNLTTPKPTFISTRKINFFSGHRTPTEQAQLDLTSGIRIRIDGIDTRTIVNHEENGLENNNKYVLKPTPVYFKSNNNNNDDDDDDGNKLGSNIINIAIHNGYNSSSSSSLSSTTLNNNNNNNNSDYDNYDDGDDCTPLSPPIFPSSSFVYDGDSFGNIGIGSHINALLSVYPEDGNLPTVHIVPATPAFEEFNERYNENNQIESLVDNNNNNNNYYRQ